MLPTNKELPKNKSCVIVLGAFRSGTSLISRVLVELGFYPGAKEELYVPTDWNPAGYIQRPDITKFNTELILDTGGTLQKPPSPESILSMCKPGKFESLNLHWMCDQDKIMIKDPRFCFTLLTWLKLGILKDFELKIIRILRDPKMAAKSSMLHYDVKSYVGSPLSCAIDVIQTYNEAAAWHCNNMQIPYLNVKYEDLISQTNECVRKTSNFLGVDDEQSINDACLAVSLGKSIIPNLG